MSADQLSAEITAIARENGMPVSLVLDLFQNRKNEPVAKRIFTTWAKETHLRFDERIYVAFMKALQARAGVFVAVTQAALQEAAAREAVADLHHVDERVEGKREDTARERELKAAQHETRMLEEREKQRRLRPNELRETLEEQSLRAQIAEQQNKQREARTGAAAETPAKPSLTDELKEAIGRAEDFKTAQAAMIAKAEQAREAAKAGGASVAEQERRYREVRNLGMDLLQKIAREQAQRRS